MGDHRRGAVGIDSGGRLGGRRRMAATTCVPGGMAERAGGVLGRGEHGHVWLPRRGGGLRARGHDHRGDGDARAGGAARGGADGAQHGRRSAAPQHLDEDRDDGVDPGVGCDRLERAAEVATGGGGEHVDGVRHGRGRGQPLAQGAAGGLLQRLDVQAGGAARVGAGDRGAARVGHDRHAAAGGQRLAREQLGDVELLVERLDADDAGMVEEGVDGGLGGLQQRAGVRRRRSPSRDGAPALDGDDRLGRVRRRAIWPKRCGLPSDSR